MDSGVPLVRFGRSNPKWDFYWVNTNGKQGVKVAVIVRGMHTEHAGCDALAYWMSLPQDQRPAGVIAITNLVAIGIMNEAERLGLTIGRDVSIIGFDDAPMTQYLRPALTTVQQAIPETGQALMTILDALLNKTEPKEPHILIPPRLIVRDSCGAPS